MTSHLISWALIPGDPTSFFWNVSAGDLTPAAGFYSSPSDLAKFGRAVLGSRQLSPAQTRRWMKPVSHTADPLTSIGAPWEISRYTLPSDPFQDGRPLRQVGRLWILHRLPRSCPRLQRRLCRQRCWLPRRHRASGEHPHGIFRSGSRRSCTVANGCEVLWRLHFSLMDSMLSR